MDMAKKNSWVDKISNEEVLAKVEENTDNENYPSETTSLDWTCFEPSQFTDRYYRRTNEGKT